MLAIATLEPQKTMSQDSAAKKGLKFLFHMPGKSLSLRFSHSFKGAKMPGHRLVENGLLRPPFAVRSGELWKAELSGHGWGGNAESVPERMLIRSLF
jgi:hypothetical protein